MAVESDTGLLPESFGIEQVEFPAVHPALLAVGGSQHDEYISKAQEWYDQAFQDLRTILANDTMAPRRNTRQGAVC